jgi:hypothetical protein
MIYGLVLIAAVAAYRLLPVFLGLGVEQPSWLPNFSPMAAMCLCGAAFLPRRYAIAIPLLALFGTDVVLNAYFGVSLFTVEFLGKTIAFCAVTALGWRLRDNARPGTILPAVLGGSFLFYLVTNTASWLWEKDYAKTFAGWVQALTTGLPGYAPAWTFYRNTLVSDLLFAGLFLVCVRGWRRPAPVPGAVPAPAVR